MTTEAQKAWDGFVAAIMKEAPPLSLRPVWSGDWWIVLVLVECLAVVVWLL